MFSLQGKTALITGAGSGIGKAIAELFAQQGAQVIVADLNASAAEEMVKTIQSGSGRALALPVNVAEQATFKSAVDGIIAKVGRIDVLVNSAGISHIGKLDTTSESDFDRIVQVNIKGVYNAMHCLIGHMKEQGGGVILNVASVAATLGLSDRFAYSMSKGAVVSMTLSVAKDYIKDNIRCNCISPARVHTAFVDGFLAKNYPGQEKEMFEKLSKTQPIGRMGKPSEIASLALYLCSDEAAFVTGSDYPIDGGFVRLNT
ncbi:glucose 1-dehydrogenase [Chryseolinea sp. T2]|uniref:SDR family NAD(P)-dependent oxidoreductase n=1 Tax=Chryseolinea sp. T2 TaxID=3129255 RepID=UPI0030787456